MDSPSSLHNVTFRIQRRCCHAEYSWATSWLCFDIAFFDDSKPSLKNDTPTAIWNITYRAYACSFLAWCASSKISRFMSSMLMNEFKRHWWRISAVQTITIFSLKCSPQTSLLHRSTLTPPNREEIGWLILFFKTAVCWKTSVTLSTYEENVSI